MGKVKIAQDLAQIDNYDDFQRWSSYSIAAIANTVNGNMNLVDNCQTQVLTVNFEKANQTMGIPHTLGYIPNGYIVISKTVDISVFDGNQKNTKDAIFLQGSTLGITRVLIF